jgi:hypothetical protein
MTDVEPIADDEVVEELFDEESVRRYLCELSVDDESNDVEGNEEASIRRFFPLSTD